MTTKWVPREERSSFVARSFMGTMVGKVITYPLCGILIDRCDKSVNWSVNQ